MNIRKLTVLIFLCWLNLVQAQVPNEPLTDKIQINSMDSGRFKFGLLHTSYMRNTEYFNPIEEGRTLFGYTLHPTISFQPAGHVIIEAGVWLRNDFGGNIPYTSALPTFSVKARKKNNEIIFGTLQGSLNHGMLEPMIDINSAILKRIENGFQYLYDNQKTKLDVWINWENFIEPNQFAKEKFTSGINLSRKITMNHGLVVQPYVQWMASHQGGQIDTDTIDPFLMQFNAAVGFKMIKEIREQTHVFLDMSYLLYQETSSSNTNPETQGNAVFINAGFTKKHTNFMVSYWNATDFIAPRGTAIYQSRSTVDPANYEKNRQLIFFRFIQNKPLFGGPILASARVEPVYDLNQQIFDFSYSLYLVYRGNWKLGKRKG